MKTLKNLKIGDQVAHGTYGVYTAKDGSEKKSWMKIGSVIQTQKGFSLKLNAVPVGLS